MFDVMSSRFVTSGRLRATPETVVWVLRFECDPGWACAPIASRTTVSAGGGGGHRARRMEGRVALPREHDLSGLRGECRVGVAVHDPPPVVLAAEDRRDAQRDRSDVGHAADPGLESLDLDDTREFRGLDMRDELEARRVAVAVVLGGALQRRLEVAPAPDRRTERVG